MIFKKIKSLLNSRSFSKALFIAVVLIHFLLYWLLGILVLVINRENLPFTLEIQLAEDLHLDFTYAQAFLTNPFTLYSSSAHLVTTLLYLPGFILYDSAWYIPCQFFFPSQFDVLYLDIYQSLVVYDFSMVLWNLVNCFLIYKIMSTNKVQAMLGNSILRNPYIVISIYMGTSIFYIDYFIGQDNAILGFFLLLGILFYFNDKEHLTYFFWGIGLWFKPIIAIFIVVLILHGSLKRFLKNATLLIFSQVPNVILFMLYPPLLHDFIVNVLFRVGSPLIFNIPVNLVQFLYQYYNVNISTSYIFIFCSLLPLTAYTFIECKKSMNFFDKLMILTLLFHNFIQGEPNQTIITLGIYVIWIATKNPRLHGSIRYLKIMIGIPFLSGLLWLVFPYNSLIYFSALIWLDLLLIFSKKELPDQAKYQT